MKKYEQPEILIEKFDIADQLALSIYEGSAPDICETDDGSWMEFEFQ